jgi:hypothetical protein
MEKVLTFEDIQKNAWSHLGEQNGYLRFCHHNRPCLVCGFHVPNGEDYWKQTENKNCDSFLGATHKSCSKTMHQVKCPPNYKISRIEYVTFYDVENEKDRSKWYDFKAQFKCCICKTFHPKPELVQVMERVGGADPYCGGDFVFVCRSEESCPRQFVKSGFDGGLFHLVGPKDKLPTLTYGNRWDAFYV